MPRICRLCHAVATPTGPPGANLSRISHDCECPVAIRLAAAREEADKFADQLLSGDHENVTVDPLYGEQGFVVTASPGTPEAYNIAINLDGLVTQTWEGS